MKYFGRMNMQTYRGTNKEFLIYLQIRRMNTYNNIRTMSFLFYCKLNPNNPKTIKGIV